jgi:hypothetical protein
MQASDVAHQPVAGSLSARPAWYAASILSNRHLFHDNYIIPLAHKLKDCGVFGVSCDEFLDYALYNNRVEWESKGRAIVCAEEAVKVDTMATMDQEGYCVKWNGLPGSPATEAFCVEPCGRWPQYSGARALASHTSSNPVDLIFCIQIIKPALNTYAY